jgi:hypothetical protein
VEPVDPVPVVPDDPVPVVPVPVDVSLVEPVVPAPVVFVPAAPVPDVVVPGVVVPVVPLVPVSLEPVVTGLPVPVVRSIVPPNQPAAQPIARMTSSATTTAIIAVRPLSLSRSVRVSLVSRVSMTVPSAKPLLALTPGIRWVTLQWFRVFRREGKCAGIRQLMTIGTVT